MQTMKSTIAAFCLLVATAYTVEAHPARRDKCVLPGAGLALAIKQLQLSDAQKKEIAGIISANRPALAAHKANLKSKTSDLLEAIHSPVFDETRIRQLHEQRAADAEEFAVVRGQILSQIRATLTVDQIKKLENYRKQLRHRMESRQEAIQLVLEGWVEDNI
jgi:periplasmic protein CpxP/Spy